MEQTVAIKQHDNGLKDLIGTWKLEYKVINPMGAMAFHGRGLTSYKNPQTGQEIRRPKAGSQEEYLIYMIARPVTFLHPDKNIQDRLDVEWLINNPEVMVEGFDDYPSHFKNTKKTNTRITLTALDYVEREHIIEEDYIDKLIGRLSLESSKDALGLDKLRYVMAELNLNYRDSRYINNTGTEKGVLRKKLKDYVRSSISNARNTNEVIDKLDDAKDTYFIKEMLRLHIIETLNGMYKYKEYSMGISVAGIKEKWMKEPDLKLRMIGDLNKEIKTK